MAPTLLIGSVALPTYPLFLLAAFWAGVWLASRRAEKLGLDGDHVYNAALYGLVAGLLGARLWFVLAHWENYASDIGQALSLSRSALAPAEGFLLAGVVALIYLQRHNVPLRLFFDAMAPGLALAVSLGSIGAFLGGEALGRPADLPWAVEMAGQARHPVQLYEALLGLAVFTVLYRLRDWRPWPGFQFWLLVAVYGLGRLFLEIFQAQPYLIGGEYLAVQVAALVTVVVALSVMAYNFTHTSPPQ